MEIAPPSTRITRPPDPLGTRHRRTTDDGVEDVLEVRQDLATAGFFEFPLRERVLRLAAFQHRSFVQVHRVERTAGRQGALAVVSGAADGVGLSDVLAMAAARSVAIPIAWALDVVRQLIDGTSAMHAIARDVSHGALTPSRILIGSGGDVVIRDYVFGAALEQLTYSSDQYWTDLGIPINPETPGIDQRLDLFQIGLVGMQLLGESVSHDTLGRAARQRAVNDVSASGASAPLVADARAWLARMLQLDAPFTSAADARKELDALLARHASVSGPVSDLHAWLPAAHDAGLARETPAAAPAVDVPRSISRFPTAAAASTDIDRTTTETKPTEFNGARLDRRFEECQPAAPVASVDAAKPLAAVPAPALHVASAPWRSARSLHRVYPAVGLAALVVAAVVALYVPINGRDARATAAPPAAASASSPQHAEPAAATDAQATTGLVGEPVGEHRPADRPRDTNVLPATGTLQIRTQPAGVQVSVDGLRAGRSPVTLSVAPGEHRIEIWSDGVSVKDVIAVQRDATTSVIIPLSVTPRADTAPAAAIAAPVAATGWVGITSPIDVDVFEGDQQIGTRETRRLMLPAGTHQLDIVNRDVGYEMRRVVNVTPGKLTPITVEVSPGTLAINALPWADVWLDGQSLGPTPIGNVKATVGSHEVVFRHPKLGEQRRTVVVSMSGVTRLSIDMGGK